MWTRHEERPMTKWGIPFRSGLEVAVAEQLDALEIEWAYERSVEHDGKIIRYLPDFTILNNTNPAMRLPKWIEVKPAEAIYAIRDAVGLPERFDDEHSYEHDSEWMRSVVDELWKPKRLAELTGHNVLVVHKINRNRTVSVQMDRTAITVSRCHPLVNWRSVLLEREREQRNREIAEMNAIRRREWAEREEARVAQDAERRSEWVRWFRTADIRSARYASSCVICGQQRQSPDIVIANNGGNWRACCRAHLT